MPKVADLPDGSDLVSASLVGTQGGTTKKFASTLVTKSHVGLGNVDNTSDANKPVSTAQQTALNGKAAAAHSHAIADVTDLQTSLDAKAASGHNHDASYAALGHNHDASYSALGHNHAGVYEPANANIQAHVASAHAPSTAQKNSDITKAEIEAKLTGEISSHTHAGGSGDVVGNDTSVSVQNIVAYAHIGGKQITELTGTGGDLLFYDAGVSSWVKLAKGTFGQVLQMNSGATSPEWAYGGIIHYSKSSGATTTGANTTPVDVSGAVFTYVANAVYRIWVMGRVNSTAATTGVGIHFNVSTAITAIDVLNVHPLTTSTPGIAYSISDDASEGVSTGVPTGPLDVPVCLNALFVPGNNTGTCQLRLRSETTAVTELMAGTVMLVQRIA